MEIVTEVSTEVKPTEAAVEPIKEKKKVSIAGYKGFSWTGKIKEYIKNVGSCKIKDCVEYLAELNGVPKNVSNARVRERLHNLRQKGTIKAITIEGSHFIDRIEWVGEPVVSKVETKVEA